MPIDTVTTEPRKTDSGVFPGVSGVAPESPAVPPTPEGKIPEPLVINGANGQVEAGSPGYMPEMPTVPVDSTKEIAQKVVSSMGESTKTMVRQVGLEAGLEERRQIAVQAKEAQQNWAPTVATPVEPAKKHWWDPIVGFFKQ